MTEEEWLACTDPIKMLDFLANSSKASDRKLRLFAVACSRRIWEFIDDLGRGAVEMAEMFADGLTDAETLRMARLACKSASGRAVWYAAASNPLIAARNTMLSIQSGVDAEREVQTNLLRDIFGNPFRPIALDPAWRTPAVVGLASQIYEGRAFNRMGDLALVLENRGCTDQEILDHCHRQEEHVKGCFLLDLILGKR